MKKEDKLFDGIGDIDDSLVDEAAKSKHNDSSNDSSVVVNMFQKKHRVPLIAAVIACVIIGSSLLLMQLVTINPNKNNNVVSQSSKPSQTPAAVTTSPTATSDTTSTINPTSTASVSDTPSTTSPISSPLELEEKLKGEWHRTNIHSSCDATITISDVTETGFHINVEAYDGGASGSLEADATFGDDGNAVAKYTSTSGHVTDISIKFSENKESFEVEYDPTTAELDFGVGVTMGGEYVKTEPVYTNSDVLNNTFTEDQLKKIKDLIGEENYNYYFLPYMEVGSVSTGTVSGGLTGKVVYVWIAHMVQENFEIVIGDNGYMYFISDSIGYHSDDPDNSQAAPKYERKLDE